MVLQCRFYEHRFPEVDDVVMVNVRSIAEMGAYVHLLEYNNIEGMILLSELSRRRIRSINKLIRVGRNECVVVIRVDKEKGYIDLSKRRVSPEEVLKCEEKYANAKHVNSILRHVAELLKYEDNSQFERLYENTAWFFDRDPKYKAKGSFECFKEAVSDPTILDACPNIDDETKSVLLSNIRRRLTPQAMKIRADVEIACYEYEGVDAVKAAIRAGLELSTEDMVIKVNLIAPPVYVVTTTTLEREEGVKRMNKALERIEETIKKAGGNFKIQLAPKVISDTDEAELAKQLEKLEEQNKEVAGDDDEDGSAEEEGSGSEDEQQEAKANEA